jgi:hypothetical protein
LGLTGTVALSTFGHNSSRAARAWGAIRPELAELFSISLRPVVTARMATINKWFEFGGRLSELVFPMILIQAGKFLYRLAWVISGLFRFAFPAAIFAYSAFAAQLTNIENKIATGASCMAIGC